MRSDIKKRDQTFPNGPGESLLVRGNLATAIRPTGPCAESLSDPDPIGDCVSVGAAGRGWCAQSTDLLASKRLSRQN